MATCDKCGRSVHEDELNEANYGCGNGGYTQWVCHSCNGRAGYVGGSTLYKSDSSDDDGDDDDY